MAEASRLTPGDERHQQGIRLLLIVAGAALLAVSLANCGQAFFFPLELEFKEGTSWLHVLTMQAGISIYDHQQVAYINMNHGPLNPVLKYLLATIFPFLSPAMVTRFFVLLLPVGLFVGMAAACPGKKGAALLWATGLHLFLLGIQPPHFLVGRSDPTALFLLALLLGAAAGPVINAATAGRRFGWIVVCGALGAMVFLTNWRLGPAIGVVGAAFALEQVAAHGRSSLWAYFGGMLLGGGGFCLLLFFTLFHGDWTLYYRHFFGFFSPESGWGAGRGDSFELFPRALLAPHWLVHLLVLVGLVLGPVFPGRSVSRQIPLLGWIPLLGLLWLTSCAAYFLNRSGGGIWYFGAFYVLLAFHLARAVDWTRIGSPWVRGLFFAGLFLGLPWQTTWRQAAQLTDSFQTAYAFLKTAKILAAGERIHSEDYYLFKDRYEGEVIDVGDEVSKINATGYMGVEFTSTANRYFAQLQSNPPRFVITGGSISPVLKELLAKSYKPVLRAPPADWPYAGPPQTFYQLKPPPPPPPSAMSAPPPLLSIVIVCRNPGPQLRAALESVWNQPGADCELVVIDGASTDGTREWLGSQRPRLGTLVSEPDRGVYDAMNKGVAAARGEWVLFLGADDRLQAGALAALAPLLRHSYGSVQVGEITYDDGRLYVLGETTTAVRRNFVHHQGACYRRALFSDHGPFDARLRVMGDYDFNLRLLKAGVEFEDLPGRIAACGSGGLSDAGGWTGYREEIAVRHRHFPAWQCWLWDLGSIIRYLRKQIVRPAPAHG